MVGGSGRLWITWHDGSQRLVGFGAVADGIPTPAQTINIGCDRSGVYCAMSYTSGMHGDYVQLFRIGTTLPVQQLEGVSSTITNTAGGLLVVLSVPADNDGTVINTYAETWQLKGRSSCARGARR